MQGAGRTRPSEASRFDQRIVAWWIRAVFQVKEAK